MEQVNSYFSFENMLLVLLGTVIYFFSHFKTNNPEKPFSILVWIKDNWYNLPITVAGTIAYFIIRKGDVTAMEAFAMGMLPNLVTDWIQKFISNAKMRDGS